MPDIHPDDLILVAVLKTARDLEIARVLGWYRIPIRSAPKTVRVEWIAFYQTGAFGPEKHAVRYVAEVRGVELSTRGDMLRDEAEHPAADEPYYKVQLGPLQTLPRPIPARRWRRITFLYTTGERLLRAQDVRDLTVPLSRERARLNRMLRERAGYPTAPLAGTPPVDGSTPGRRVHP